MLRLVLCLGAALPLPAQFEHFETRIRPVLAANCYGCHSAAAPVPQGGLQLDSVEGIRRGGNSGPLFEAGKAEGSLLLRALSHRDKTLKMPPGKPLEAAAVAEFEKWIAAGAPMPEGGKPEAAGGVKLWSLQPVKPSSRSIDELIGEKLREKGLRMSPEADRRTLIRRAYFDLTGLPPSAGEIEAFVADQSPKAYERLIDRLLASPHYGERWGRHWLDVARYADSANNAVNQGQFYAWSYTYRDWVIRAFNEDMPYDRFVTYQLAADRMKGEDPKHLAALGFLTLGREFPKSFPETVDDRIDVVTRGLLGLTVACARCHDHKYDPVPARDYYSLYSVFSNTRPPEDLPLLATSFTAGEKDRMYLSRLEKIRESFHEYRRRRHGEMLAFFRSQETEYRKAAKDSAGMTAPEVEELARDRQLNLHVVNRWRKHLGDAAAMPDPLAIPLEDFALIYTEGDSNNSRDFQTRYNAVLSQYSYDGAPARAMALEDVPDPKPAHVFVRGNPNHPGALAPARFLSAIAGQDAPLFRDGAGRLDLAKAIVDPGNPLTARVFVNRVWMHHFGAGLVRTPSDFGRRGDPPTHPELLDKLAADFAASGWRVKRLHREIMLSAAYRQASGDVEEARRIDPENLLLWRMNRRRLEIEALRDSMLAAAGRLSPEMGGRPFLLTAQPSEPRRTVYGFVERGRVPAAFLAFDFASPDQHAPMRYVTTVPQQALYFLNSPFVAEQAAHLAGRVNRADPNEGIREMYRRVFGRDPEAAEREAGLRFLQAGGGEEAAGPAASAWRYGIGRFDEAAGRIAGFREFPTFTGDAWQGGSALPAEGFGKAVLRAAGGEPGESPEQAVVRRWISPVRGTVTIEGTLRHAQAAIKYGDGVRGRIVSSRLGVLGSWTVTGKAEETKVTAEGVEPGETIDFHVDSNQDYERDGFTWSPVVKAAGREWAAKEGFRGPPAPKLDVWARYAQALLCTNEFAFVD
jgi:hypothetical protein